MKHKFLSTALAIIIFFGASAQRYSDPTLPAKAEKRVRVDSTLLVPTGCGAPWALSALDIAQKHSAEYFDSCNHRKYIYDPKLAAWDTIHVGAASGSMVYPGAGLAKSTGSAWATSITDNSSNWNTAFGWGNHASAGYAASIGNLSPLFTAALGSGAISFSLSNAAAYSLFGRGASTGVPSYLASIDSNWIPHLHSENYYNTKYLGIGASPAGAWLKTGNSGTTPGTHFLGTTDAVALIFKSNSIQIGKLTHTSVQFGLSTNNASGSLSTISGGENNTASGEYSIVGGGAGNTASGNEATVSGGTANNATGNYALIAGGDENTASGEFSVISGGVSHLASGTHTVIGGGESNKATGSFASVLGGEANISSGYYSSILGGISNKSKSYSGVVAGQYNDSANATSSTAFNTANRAFQIGIGTADNARANAMTVLFNGNVGIGTTTPATTFELVGTQRLTSLTASLPLKLDASKNIISQAIALASSEISGLLPIANGGTNNASLPVTAGTVYFGDGSKIIGDNSNFFWDNSNKRLGIGTTSPSQKLHVQSSGTTSLFKSTGYSASTVIIEDPDGTTYLTNGQFKVNSVPFVLNANASYIGLQTAGVERARVLNTGEVGIGTSTPNSTLHVAGSLSLGYRMVESDSYEIAITDYTLSVNNGASDWSIILPDASTCTGRIYIIKRYDNNSTGLVIVDANSCDVQSPATGSFNTTFDLTAWGTQNQSVMFQSNGTNWEAIK